MPCQGRLFECLLIFDVLHISAITKEAPAIPQERRSVLLAMGGVLFLEALLISATI